METLDKEKTDHREEVIPEKTQEIQEGIEKTEETEETTDLTQEKESNELKDELTLVESEAEKKSPEKKDITIESPDFKVETLMDLEAKRVQSLKLPIEFGNIGEKQPKKDIVSIDGVELRSLGQSLYNFKYVREEGTGNKKIYLKSRECKIILSGTIYQNGSVGMTKLLAYSISKELSFKRALEVYTFMQKVFSGNQVEVLGENLNLELVIPERYEYLKLLKIVDILYKYYSISKEMELNQSEKVDIILSNASKITDLSNLMRGRAIETMVKLEGELQKELLEAKSLKLIIKKSIKLKKLNIDYTKEVRIPEFVLENKENSEKMSTSWKKAEISYKKCLIS